MGGERISPRRKFSNSVPVYLSLLAFLLVLLFLARAFGTKVEVLFSPQDDCAAQIFHHLNEAQESIDVAVYYFTNRILAQALVRAKERGIRVRVYLDESQKSGKYSKGRYLEGKGVSVKYEDGVGLMHDKFCIIDGDRVITGSFNWTVAADLKNDENLLIIRSRKLAQEYEDHFERFWEGTYVDECRYKDKDRLEKERIR